MSDKIHDMQRGCGEGVVMVSNGYYAVHPSGNVVLLPVHARLKDGFRLATEADLEPSDVVEIDVDVEDESSEITEGLIDAILAAPVPDENTKFPKFDDADAPTEPEAA
jgi:hypothetical protein